MVETSLLQCISSCMQQNSMLVVELLLPGLYTGTLFWTMGADFKSTKELMSGVSNPANRSIYTNEASRRILNIKMQIGANAGAKDATVQSLMGIRKVLSTPFGKIVSTANTGAVLAEGILNIIPELACITLCSKDPCMY